MSSLPDLSYDIYQYIIEAVAVGSTEGARDESCVKTLLACCLVNHDWCRLAQPILNQTVIVNSEDHLNRRVLARWKDHHLSGLRKIVFRETWGEQFSVNVEHVLRALPNSHQLRSFVCFDGAHFPSSSDEMDRTLVGTFQFSPQPLVLDLSGLREALLGPISFGPSWVRFLLAASNLQYLTFHHCGWWGHSSYANSPLYLPAEPPPFRLKRLEIFRSHIKEAPLRWLLSGGSSETLDHLTVGFPQPEWDTFRNLSEMRAQGVLPNLSHLTYTLQDDGGGSNKHYNDNTSIPLGVWNGVKSVSIYGRDAKALAAIIHGISKLSPPPSVELGVGDMRLFEFKALFRLRKGKLQPGTELRLLTKRPMGPRRSGAYYRWDEDAESYWTEVEEDAAEIANKYGVRVEVSKRPIF